jgi:hypothetical protein
MSVVAVRVYDKKIEIASDSIAVLYNTSVTDKFSKLEQINGMIIGGVGLIEELSLLYFFAESHKPISCASSDVLNFFVEFAEWKNVRTKKFSIENSYIFIYDGLVYFVSNFLIQEITDFFAIGAGEDHAWTALYLKHSVEDAVGIACKLCPFCSEPVVKIVVKKVA